MIRFCEKRQFSYVISNENDSSARVVRDNGRVEDIPKIQPLNKRSNTHQEEQETLLFPSSTQRESPTLRQRV